MTRTLSTGFEMSLNQETGAPSVWIEVIPAGEIQGRDGRRFKNPSPERIVSRFREDGASLPIDIEHSTELKAPQGDPAPAVGWIEALEVRNGAVWANVSWSTTAVDLIMNREYRYYSPVFLLEKNSNKVLRLLSVGLTNRPNLYVRALSTEGETMDFLNQVKQAAGLPDTATEAETLSKITALNADLEKALNREQTPDLTQFVPRADYDALSQKALNAENALAAQRKERFDALVNQEVGAAVIAGKITPATQEFYKRMCNSEEGLASFREFVKAAPVVTKESGLSGRKPEEEKALNAEAVSVGRFFGNSIDDLKKYGGE